LGALPLYAGLLAQLLAADPGPVCTLPTPEHFVERAVPGALKSVVENVARENVVVRSHLTLRAPVSGTLEQAVRAARAEEKAALGEKADFELVRDGPLPQATLSNRLLVYRYRPTRGGPVVLRFHAIYSTGFQVLHLVGESQATQIDALELPYREAGLHEPWMRPAMSALRCQL
jgi:hypothetical protein